MVFISFDIKVVILHATRQASNGDNFLYTPTFKYTILNINNITHLLMLNSYKYSSFSAQNDLPASTRRKS